MSIDVSDATFEVEVLARSEQVPVVVDLWAPWCGPCHSLSPVLEKVVDEHEGRVVLAKVDIDQNPTTAASFQVQSIPAVYGLRDRKVVNGFLGARGEREVRQFVEELLPSAEEQQLASLVAAGDEASLRQALELDPGHLPAVLALGEVLLAEGRTDEVVELAGRVPETDEVKRLFARARHGDVTSDADVEVRLGELLEQVKADDDARREFLELLELFGPDDERSTRWRKRLSARLY